LLPDQAGLVSKFKEAQMLHHVLVIQRWRQGLAWGN
jgi:hypothetical protein